MEFSVERLRPLLDLVLAAFRRDPSVTAQQQILVAAAAFLVVSLLVVLMLLVFAPKKRRLVRRRRLVGAHSAPVDTASAAGDIDSPRSDSGVEELPRRQPARPSTALTRALLGLPGMMLLTVLFAVVAYEVTDTNAYCTYRCHQSLVEQVVEPGTAPLTATAVATASVELSAESAHHERCTDCHALDVVSDVADRSRMAVVAFTGSGETSASAIVASSSCLECHGYVLDNVVIGAGGSIKMSHAEPYDAGMSCMMCHRRIGHAGALSPEMTSCLECHDSKQASAACETCHVGNPADQSSKSKPVGAASKRTYRLVELDSNRCYECHDPRPCDSCHRVRVPHTTEFLTGRHARPAAWAGKQQCRMCHDQNMCSGCHLSFANSHYAGFQSDHRKLTPAANCGCHDRRRPERTEPFCTVCHW
ncbi:MAG: hypothetical protein U1E29_13765 [Coriobacteriia bacterium]|nr:hypothetical protein [Coriobacteriia bacterium]